VRGDKRLHHALPVQTVERYIHTRCSAVNHAQQRLFQLRAFGRCAGGRGRVGVEVNGVVQGSVYLRHRRRAGVLLPGGVGGVTAARAVGPVGGLTAFGQRVEPRHRDTGHDMPREPPAARIQAIHQGAGGVAQLQVFTAVLQRAGVELIGHNARQGRIGGAFQEIVAVRRNDAAEVNIGRAIRAAKRPAAEIDGAGRVVVELQPLR